MGTTQPDRIFPTGGRHTGLHQDRRSGWSPLEEVFCRWKDELFGTLYILLGSLREAQEAFQETFRHCWRRREQLSNLSDRKLWIFRTALEIARQRRATAWRRRWRLWNLETSDEELSDASAGPTPEEHPNDPIAFWRRTLMELPPEEQEVFLLRQNAQMTYEQIADLLLAPLGVVKAQMHRAINKLLQVAGAPLPADLRTEPAPSVLGPEPVQPAAIQSATAQADQNAHQAQPDPQPPEQAPVVIRIVAEPPGSPVQKEEDAKPETIPILPIG